MFSLGSVAVAWSSKKEPKVALSSTEVEYRGATVTTCEAKWVRRLLQDLRIAVPTPILIYCDNINNMQLAKCRIRVYNGRIHTVPLGYLCK